MDNLIEDELWDHYSGLPNPMWYQQLTQVRDEETLQETVTRFINRGVHQTKIITTELPSVVIWSKTRKCLVGGKDQPDLLEIVVDVEGNQKATYDNNIFISLQNRSELTESEVKEINESEGIVITNATYGKPYFRFGFIPN